jgi:hypothetical protein
MFPNRLAVSINRHSFGVPYVPHICNCDTEVNMGCCQVHRFENEELLMHSLTTSMRQGPNKDSDGFDDTSLTHNKEFYSLFPDEVNPLNVVDSPTFKTLQNKTKPQDNALFGVTPGERRPSDSRKIMETPKFGQFLKAQNQIFSFEDEKSKQAPPKPVESNEENKASV